MIKINSKKENGELIRNYCKCGRFLCEEEKGWFRFPRGVSIISDGKVFSVKCKCELITKFEKK